MQPESVKCECLHMFPITAPGQRAPLTKQELPKHSQATDRKATSNRKSSFKDTRGVLALAERRANQRKGASPNLGIEEQYLIDAEGEKMERLTSFPHVNPYTESETNVEDEDWEDDDKYRSLSYMETVTSRTVRYIGTSTVEKSPRINGVRRSYTRWGTSDRK